MINRITEHCSDFTEKTLFQRQKFLLFVSISNSKETIYYRNIAKSFFRIGGIRFVLEKIDVVDLRYPIS